MTDNIPIYFRSNRPQVTDELIAEMLRQRKSSGAINEDDFDEIVTEAANDAGAVTGEN